MKKHTPLPWKAVDMRDGVYTIRSGEQIVATVHHIGIEPSERVPNAHLIEDAVNHHEELVGMCKDALCVLNAHAVGFATQKAIQELLAKLEVKP